VILTAIAAAILGFFLGAVVMAMFAVGGRLDDD
jgi:purine-cytosine permease-like protein